MHDRPFRDAAKHTIIPFSSGVIFFMFVMGTTLAIGFLGSDYTLPNNALDIIGADTLGYVVLAALLGETMFGWKKKTGSRFDWIATLAQTLKENLCFLLGIAFGLFLLVMILANVSQTRPLPTVQASVMMLMACGIAVAYEVLRDHIRREFRSSTSTLIFFGLSLFVLGLLWWFA